MAHTITIETQSDDDFALLKGLAQRMGLRTKEYHSDYNPSKAEQEIALEKFTGSWGGEETGDELNAMIRNSRYDGPRDIAL